MRRKFENHIIPLTKPYWGKEEERAAVLAMRASPCAGDGPYHRKLVSILRKHITSRTIIPVTSCTHGMELALRALGLRNGDEVIVPSFTMSSTANAVILAGGIPVFADIEEKFYTIDPRDIERCISKKTRGIIVVHYAGMACRMEEIMAIARKHKLFVLEDAAHSIGSSYKGKALGCMGDIGAFSFHGTKNVTCGEGGLVITDSIKLAGFMEIFRANGTNRDAFLRGEIDKYSWVSAGSSYFLSDILAAVLCEQVKKIPQIVSSRSEIASFYTRSLSQFSVKPPNIILPSVPKGAKPNWHIYAIRFRKKKQAEIFIKKMNEKGIGATFHFVPLHTSRMGRNLSRITNRPYENRNLPVTERVAETLVRLPIYPSLTKKDLSYIIQSARHAFRFIRKL